MSLLQILGGMGHGYAKGVQQREDMLHKRAERNRLEQENRDFELKQAEQEWLGRTMNSFFQPPQQSGPTQPQPGSMPVVNHNPIPPASPEADKRNPIQRGLNRIGAALGGGGQQPEAGPPPMQPVGPLRTDMGFDEFAEQYKTLRMRAAQNPRFTEMYQPAQDAVRDMALAKWREQYQGNIDTVEGALDFARHMATGTAKLGAIPEQDQNWLKDLLDVQTGAINQQNADSATMNAESSRLTAQTKAATENRIAAENAETNAERNRLAAERRAEQEAQDLYNRQVSAAGDMHLILQQITAGVIRTPEQATEAFANMNIAGWEGATVDSITRDEAIPFHGMTMPGHRITVRLNGETHELNTLQMMEMATELGEMAVPPMPPVDFARLEASMTKEIGAAFDRYAQAGSLLERMPGDAPAIRSAIGDVAHTVLHSLIYRSGLDHSQVNAAAIGAHITEMIIHQRVPAYLHGAKEVAKEQLAANGTNNPTEKEINALANQIMAQSRQAIMASVYEKFFPDQVAAARARGDVPGTGEDGAGGTAPTQEDIAAAAEGLNFDREESSAAQSAGQSVRGAVGSGLNYLLDDHAQKRDEMLRLLHGEETQRTTRSFRHDIAAIGDFFQGLFQGAPPDIQERFSPVLEAINEGDMAAAQIRLQELARFLNTNKHNATSEQLDQLHQLEEMIKNAVRSAPQ